VNAQTVAIFVVLFFWIVSTFMGLKTAFESDSTTAVVLVSIISGVWLWAIVVLWQLVLDLGCASV